MSANNIFAKYSEELKVVDRQLMNIVKSSVFLIPTVGRHILNSGGKRIRPLFFLLGADLCGYRETSRALMAAIIEAIHTASLLHDDVIDDAKTRRGKLTAHSLWGNQVAVLVGDFLYSNALKLAVEQRNQRIMEALSETTTQMAEGEIFQLHKAGNPEITKEEYFKIISTKTGLLISAACRIAGILSNQPEERENALAQFGMKAGIAFQLADDILDYVAEQKELGKRLGKDLEESKITMPLIHLLMVASELERDEVKDIILQCSHLVEKKKSLLSHYTIHNPHIENSGLKRILELFSKYNAIEESLKVANTLVEEARAELNIFPASEEKDALITMAEYAMQRKR